MSIRLHYDWSTDALMEVSPLSVSSRAPSLAPMIDISFGRPNPLPSAMRAGLSSEPPQGGHYAPCKVRLPVQKPWDDQGSQAGKEEEGRGGRQRRQRRHHHAHPPDEVSLLPIPRCSRSPNHGSASDSLLPIPSFLLLSRPGSAVSEFISQQIQFKEVIAQQAQVAPQPKLLQRPSGTRKSKYGSGGGIPPVPTLPSVPSGGYQLRD